MFTSEITDHCAKVEMARGDGTLRVPLFLFLAGVLVRVGFLMCYPALYGGDTVFHLRNHDHLMVGHQPPMLQAVLYLTHRVSTNPLAPRLVMVAISALAGVGFYLMSTTMMSERAAVWAAAFVITNPFLSEISLVPFQESLMAGLLFFALSCFWSQQLIPGTIFLACACWTRYEAWILCPVLAIDYLERRGWTGRNVLQAMGMFAAGPMLWIAMHHGLSSPGAYAIEWPRSAARVMRWVYLSWVCIKQTPAPVLICAAFCVWSSWRERRIQHRGWRLAIVFLVLYLGATISAAHGIGHTGMENPELFLGAREATLLVCFTLLLAGLGFARLLGEGRSRKVGLSAGFAAIVLGLLQSWLLIRSQASQPDVAVDYQVARYLSHHAEQSERVLFIAKPFSASDWSYYLEQAERLQGRSGLEAARRSLRNADLSPMDFQRTAIQVDLPEANLSSSGDPLSFAWVVYWNNVELPTSLSKEIGSFERVWRAEKGGLSATILRRRGV